MTSQLLPRSHLPPDREEQMFALLDAHFTGVSRDQFLRDLDEKNWVILLVDSESRLRGFSTILFYEAAWNEERLGVVCSGDTIVDPRARTSSLLSKAWIDAVSRLSRQSSFEKVFWLLLTSGFRTYRFLPVFWREFWPRVESRTPPEMQHLLDALARERFGDAFDADAGIVRFKAPQCLRSSLVDMPAGRLRNPHIAFFSQRNPSCRAGDELVCLCELSEANLTRAGRRMILPLRS